MLEFPQNIDAHMPFIAHGAGRTTRRVCCLKVAGRWKVHAFANGGWSRVQTGMPEDTTECSPFVEYDPVAGKWRMTFIAGGSRTDADKMRFALYGIDDLDNLAAERIVGASAGYRWKGVVVHAGLTGGIDIEYRDGRRHIELDGPEYIYRIAPNADDPQDLLVTGQMPGGEIFTWALHLMRRTIDALTGGGQSLYKPCCCDGRWHTARRIGDFEERRIEEVAVERTPLRWDKIVRMEDERTMEDED